MEIFYQWWKKYNDIQLTKNHNGLEQSKNEKSSALRYSSKGESFIYPWWCDCIHLPSLDKIALYKPNEILN